MRQLLAGGGLLRECQHVVPEEGGPSRAARGGQAGHDVDLQDQFMLGQALGLDEGQVGRSGFQDLLVPAEFVQGEHDVDARGGLQGHMPGPLGQQAHLAERLQRQFMIPEVRLDRTDVPERAGLPGVILVCLGEVQAGEVMLHRFPVLAVRTGDEAQAVQGPGLRNAVTDVQGSVAALSKGLPGRREVSAGEERASKQCQCAGLAAQVFLLLHKLVDALEQNGRLQGIGGNEAFRGVQPRLPGRRGFRGEPGVLQHIGR